MTKLLKRLNSGKLVDVANLTADDITMEDIVHSLQMACRYDGHVPRHYSVLEHSVLVCEMVPVEFSPHIRLLALLHDAAECYIGDIQSCIKDHLYIRLENGRSPNMRTFESKILLTICDKFGINTDLYGLAAVDIFDKELTRQEMDHFFHGAENDKFTPEMRVMTRIRFMKLFNDLREEIRNEQPVGITDTARDSEVEEGND